MNLQTKKAIKIITSIKGKNVVNRRWNALVDAGFNPSDPYIKWNFGKVGTIKLYDDYFEIQIAYATGGKSRHNGYGVNACPVVKIPISVEVELHKQSSKQIEEISIMPKGYKSPKSVLKFYGLNFTLTKNK